MPTIAISPFTNTILDIEKERIRQDARWGGPERDDTNTEKQWVSLIDLYITKAVIALQTDYVDSLDYREELVKVAALAVAAIESYDRKRSAASGPLGGVRHIRAKCPYAVAGDAFPVAGDDAISADPGDGGNRSQADGSYHGDDGGG